MSDQNTIEIFIDVTKPARSALVSDASATQAARARIDYVLRDTPIQRIHLLDGTNGPIELGEDDVLSLGAKPAANVAKEDEPFCFYATSFEVNEDDAYEAELNLNTVEFNDAFRGSTLALLVEVELYNTSTGIRRTLAQFQATGIYDVIRGDEGLPSSSDEDIVFPARLVVLGGTAVELDAMTPVPAANEIRIETDTTGKPVAIRVGAADGRPGGYRIGYNSGVSGGIDIHVPGSITIVCGQNEGTVSLMPISRDGGQVAALWWDGTIDADDPYPIGATLDKDVDDPDALWTNAPKIIRVFPVSTTDALKSFRFFNQLSDYPNISAIDWRGTPLEMVSLTNSPNLLSIPPLPSSLKQLTVTGTGIKSLDLGGINEDGEYITLVITSNPELTSIRALGIGPTTVTEWEMEGWDIRDNALSASALNAFFADLPDRSGLADKYEIYVGGNPGALTCDTSIAEDKGYYVNTIDPL